MEGLYPIIRRKRRPLVSVGDAVRAGLTGVSPVTKAPSAQSTDETTTERSRTSDNEDGVKNEEASTTERTRPTVVG